MLEKDFLGKRNHHCPAWLITVNQTEGPLSWYYCYLIGAGINVSGLIHGSSWCTAVIASAGVLDYGVPASADYNVAGKISQISFLHHHTKITQGNRNVP